MQTPSAPLDILLTNDDGIYAEGLWTLYDALRENHQVWVVAPDRERSAVGHGITLHQPLRITQVKINGYQGWAVNGTPADCVKLALAELAGKRPDLVISGINPGANVGVNLNYSGTVAAAKEAALNGVAAVAVSIPYAPELHYATAAGIIAQWVDKIHARKLPSGTFLNINIPNKPIGQIAGARISRQGHGLFDEYFEKRRDPRNRVYYWQGSESPLRYTDEDADGTLLAADFVSITPVRCDMTDFGVLSDLKHWETEPVAKSASQTNGPDALGFPRKSAADR